MDTPRPSLADLFSAELHNKAAADVTAEHYRSRILGQPRAFAGSDAERTQPPSPLTTTEAHLAECMAQGHGLLRVYGFLFAMKYAVPRAASAVR